MKTTTTRKLFPRKILTEILPCLDKPGIILLVGARQTGKTSIMYLMMETLREKGIGEEKIHYFDLEDLTMLDVFNSGVKEFTAYLKASGVDTDAVNYIFVDEIQYMENPANFLKLIADHQQNFKMIVSGSSTLEIRRKFSDSLAGRKTVFELYPLDFSETLLFKGEKRLLDTLTKSDIRHMDRDGSVSDLPSRFFMDDLARHFNEYLIYGGYPGAVLEADYTAKAVYLTDIYNSYVKKDIKDIMRIDNIRGFNNLLKALALQTGNLVNLNELSTTVKIARNTLERYLFLLENTFIIKMVSPYSRNPRKEISKMQKVFFIDTGLRNIILRNTAHPDDRPDSGALAENGVFSNIIKNTSVLQEIHFWRTISKNEVDFVITEGGEVTPVEVKYSSFKRPGIPSGIRQFQKDHPAKHSFVLTKDYFGKNDNTIFVPALLC
jgi:predicted AAA+ superfamily ATPase